MASGNSLSIRGSQGNGQETKGSLQLFLLVFLFFKDPQEKWPKLPGPGPGAAGGHGQLCGATKLRGAEAGELLSSAGAFARAKTNSSDPSAFMASPPLMLPYLDCYWVGSLDFNSLVEIKWWFPLSPQKVELFAGGSTATKLLADPYIELLEVL